MKTMIRMLAIALLGLTSVAHANEDEMTDGEHGLQQVYFGHDSADPLSGTLMIANLLQCKPTETVILDAYTDPNGSEEYNVDLAQRRAEAVRDKLVAHGISKDRILIGVFGETTSGKDYAHDRRVDIKMSAEPVATLIERRKLTAVAVVTSSGTKIEARATIPPVDMN